MLYPLYLPVGCDTCDLRFQRSVPSNLTFAPGTSSCQSSGQKGLRFWWIWAGYSWDLMIRCHLLQHRVIWCNLNSSHLSQKSVISIPFPKANFAWICTFDVSFDTLQTTPKIWWSNRSKQRNPIQYQLKLQEHPATHVNPCSIMCYHIQHISTPWSSMRFAIFTIFTHRKGPKHCAQPLFGVHSLAIGHEFQAQEVGSQLPWRGMLLLLLVAETPKTWIGFKILKLPPRKASSSLPLSSVRDIVITCVSKRGESGDRVWSVAASTVVQQ